eukprot:TRINITY_DN25117_c0_g1_i1.p1 TRINITY_DN25117_c0_g1~~TRINITY_DN25117_c0_g1_i1.p1  ORF type:complete len:122 (+),score=7.36 TRINITY_DN25117_c0_g1_i1:50-415(+)
MRIGCTTITHTTYSHIRLTLPQSDCADGADEISVMRAQTKKAIKRPDITHTQQTAQQTATVAGPSKLPSEDPSLIPANMSLFLLPCWPSADESWFILMYQNIVGPRPITAMFGLDQIQITK